MEKINFVAIIFNQRRTPEKNLWAIQIKYDLNNGQGEYIGKIYGQSYGVRFKGDFNSENKTNFLNANLYTEKGVLGLYHKTQVEKQTFGLGEPSSTNYAFESWDEKEGTKIPTSIVTTIADAFNILNDISIGDLPLGEKGADAINEKFKDFNGTVKYIMRRDGNHSFRFTVKGTDISFMIDYILTNDEDEKNDNKK